MSRSNGYLAAGSGDWMLTFVSLMALASVARVGSAGVALFLAPWAIIFFRAPRAAVAGVVRNLPLLILPIFALASMLWSDEKIFTLKHGFEFFLTYLAAIWAAFCVKPATFISALFFACLVVMILSVTVGREGIDEGAGGYVLVGIFESKNQLALYASILILVSLTLMLDSARPAWMRLLSIAAMAPAIMALLVSRSTGSILFCTASAAGVLFLRFITLLPKQVRVMVFLVGFLLAAAGAAAIALALSGGLGSVLGSVGKDASLTGRTDLWDSALRLIGQRPVLGLGFNAFWHIGNPEAERLWRISSVPPGAGFNFHNLYLNTAVELGLVGMGILVALFLATAFRYIVAMIYCPMPHHFLGVSVFMYIMLLSPIEAYFLNEFNLGTLLLAVAWCYSAPLIPSARAAFLAR